jgi:hypothetical protein
MKGDDDDDFEIALSQKRNNLFFLPPGSFMPDVLWIAVLRSLFRPKRSTLYCGCLPGVYFYRDSSRHQTHNWSYLPRVILYRQKV